VILVLAMAAVAFCAAGLPRLTINNNTRAFFGPHNPQYLALQAFEKTYRNEQNVLLVIAPKDGHVFTRSTLAAVAELTEAAWQIPYSHRVTSISNSPHAQAKGDDLVVSALVPDVNGLSDAEIARIREIALSDPILVGYLVSGSGHCPANPGRRSRMWSRPPDVCRRPFARPTPRSTYT